MASKDYQFAILGDTLAPFGPVGKENFDITRLVFDFSCWLNLVDNENLVEIEVPTIQAMPWGFAPLGGTWRQDYPLDQPADPSTPPPPDQYPLRMYATAITGSEGEIAELKVQAGTPGYTYSVSFLVTSSTTRRRKQVDCYVSVEIPINPDMVGLGDPAPVLQGPLQISDTTALPSGFEGWVMLSNSSSSDGITITLPPNPQLGQWVGFMDVLGTDGLHYVTFRADGDLPVDSDGALTFVSSFGYDVLQWMYDGSNWHLQTNRYGFLG